MLELASRPICAKSFSATAPNVIGAAEWHEHRERYALGAMIATLDDLPKRRHPCGQTRSFWR